MNGSSIIHQWVHKNLLDRSYQGEINRKEVVIFISRLCSLKRKYVKVFIKELEELKYVKPVNRFTLYICKVKNGFENL